MGSSGGDAAILAATEDVNAVKRIVAAAKWPKERADMSMFEMKKIYEC